MPFLLKPVWYLNSSLLFPSPPFFVVIITTPFAPREPYRAIVAASLSTVIDSTSSGLILDIPPVYSTPSTMMSALLLDEYEPIPLTRIPGEEPGLPEGAVVWTPGPEPCKATNGLEIGRLSRSFADMVTAEPVKSDFFTAP